MKEYVPQARSLAAKVCAELAARPRALSAREIAMLFGVPSSHVNASLRACVEHGALLMRSVTNFNRRSHGEYYPPGFEPPEVIDEPAMRPIKGKPLEIVMHDDGYIHVRGHLIGVDDEGLAVFTDKQIAYLVERVCTPMIETTP